MILKTVDSPIGRSGNDIRFFAGPVLDLNRIDISEALQKMGILLDITEEELIKKVEEIKDDPEKLAILSGVIEKAAARLQNDPEHLAERTRAALDSTIRFIHTKTTEEESETESSYKPSKGITNKIVDIIFGSFVTKAMSGLSFREQIQQWKEKRKKDSE